MCCAAAKKAGQDSKVVVAQIAPAVRVAIAETMGLAPGEVTVGQLVTGLRQLGFDYVFGRCLLPSSLCLYAVATALVGQRPPHNAVVVGRLFQCTWCMTGYPNLDVVAWPCDQQLLAALSHTGRQHP